MKLPDQVRETIRQVTGLAADHPIQDDWPLYSLGITPLGEVHICMDLAKRIEINAWALLAEVLVGSNLASHTVPYLVHSITEVLTNDSTTSTSPQQSSADQLRDASSEAGWSSSPNAAAG